jgi:hypothetical protein
VDQVGLLRAARGLLSVLLQNRCQPSNRASFNLLDEHSKKQIEKMSSNEIQKQKEKQTLIDRGT